MQSCAREKIFKNRSSDKLQAVKWRVLYLKAIFLSVFSRDSYRSLKCITILIRTLPSTDYSMIWLVEGNSWRNWRSVSLSILIRLHYVILHYKYAYSAIFQNFTASDKCRWAIYGWSHIVCFPRSGHAVVLVVVFCDCKRGAEVNRKCITKPYHQCFRQSSKEDVLKLLLKFY